MLKTGCHENICWFLTTGYHAVVGPRYKMAATSNIFLNQTSVQPSPQHPYLQPRSSPGILDEGTELVAYVLLKKYMQTVEKKNSCLEQNEKGVSLR